MTDRPLFGQRVWDVLTAVECLWQRTFISVQIDKGRLACVGRGAGGLLALCAAALDERLAAVVAWEAPPSYKSLIVERPDFPTSVYLFDVLSHFDVPQLMAAVAPRPLLLAEPVDGLRHAMPEDQVAAHLGWPRQIYTLQGSEAHLQTWAQPEMPATPKRIAHWLQEHLS